MLCFSLFWHPVSNHVLVLPSFEPREAGRQTKVILNSEESTGIRRVHEKRPDQAGLLCRSAGKGVRGQPLHAQPFYYEEAPGVFFLLGLVHAGGDIKI